MIEQLRLDLGVEVLVLLMERDKTFVGLRPLGQLVEVLKLPSRRRAAELSGRRPDLDRDRGVLRTPGRTLTGRCPQSITNPRRAPSEALALSSLRPPIKVAREMVS